MSVCNIRPLAIGAHVGMCCPATLCFTLEGHRTCAFTVMCVLQALSVVLVVFKADLAVAAHTEVSGVAPICLAFTLGISALARWGICCTACFLSYVKNPECLAFSAQSIILVETFIFFAVIFCFSYTSLSVG